MTKYQKFGSNVVIIDRYEDNILNKIPSETFLVSFNPNNESYFLEQMSDLKVSDKVYGDVENIADRILYTFDDRKVSTGVLLTGEKGSGKTLLAKILSKKLKKAEIPTILVSSPFCDDNFKSFIQSIDDKCMILFDEFEKVYSSKEQMQLLTMFDGVMSSKKLFVITSNNEHRLDSNMMNRPGRFFYALHYDSISIKQIKEYAKDNLKNKNNIDSLIKLGEVLSNMNFDMLKALVEEMNRFDCSVKTALQFLNISPRKILFNYELVNFVLLDEELANRSKPTKNNMNYNIDIEEDVVHVNLENKSGKLELNYNETEIYFKQQDITSIKDGIVTYEKPNLAVASFARRSIKRKNYDIKNML